MDKVDFIVELPKFREEEYLITEFGAVSGGGISNSPAIQRAIDQAESQGGGHVIVPKGLWLTGPIELKSGVDFHLERGALLVFHKNSQEYPLCMADYEGTKRIRARSPIFAKGARDIGISGQGVIDGSGHLWRMAKEFKFSVKDWKKRREQSSDTMAETEEGQLWFPSETAFKGFLQGEPDLTALTEEEALCLASPYYDYYRPVMVSLIGCTRILVEGVTLQNSPAWNLHPLFCTNLTIRDAWIRNESYAQNGDGLDLESSSKVEIARVSFDVGDDAICMKSGKNAEARRIPGPTEQVYIHDCIVYRGHGGFVVGSEMSRGVRHILVENCTFMGTDIGIRFKTTLGRGGIIEDITIRNINMIHIPGEAIVMTTGYVLKTVKGGTLTEEKAPSVEEEDIPEIRNITISEIRGLDIECGIRIIGLPMRPIHDIRLRDIRLQVCKECEIYYGERIEMTDVEYVPPC